MSRNPISGRISYPCPPTARGGCGAAAIYVQGFHSIEGFGRVYGYACDNCGRIRVSRDGMLHSVPDAGTVWADRQEVKAAIAKAEALPLHEGSGE